MTQSAPSKMALATSDDSALVGLGFLIILSSICVAQTIGLPARLQRPIIIFCARKIFSVGISMPRSPRATITPSVASRISSNRLTPSWFSILQMILMLRPLSPSTCHHHHHHHHQQQQQLQHSSICTRTLNRIRGSYAYVSFDSQGYYVTYKLAPYPFSNNSWQ